VIRNPTPTEDLDNSQITMFKDESESEVQSILIKEDNSDDELEKTFMNLCPSFPVNNVNKNTQASPYESDNELTNSYTHRLSIYNKFKTNSRTNTGKSFGSKCLSHKMTPKTENLRFEEPGSHSDSSKDSISYERKISHKEIIIENLNSYCSKSNGSIDDRTKYMNTSNNNEFKMTYLSDKYRDFDNCKN
jgi:hypothetical protein